MKSICIMVLGIGLLLVSIFCELLAINKIIGEFWVYYLPIGIVVIGIICLFLGLVEFFEDEKNR